MASPQLSTQQPSSRKPRVARVAFQRYHAALQPGHSLTVQLKRQAPVSVVFTQGSLDGACGLHVLCMMLSILGLARADALMHASSRKYGVPAAVWSAFADTYFQGVHAPEFVERVKRLGLPVDLKLVKDAAQIDSFVMANLMNGELVALTFASIRNRLTRHWALGVGVQGMTAGRESRVTALLLLDPTYAEPGFGAVFNARLRLLDSDKKPVKASAATGSISAAAAQPAASAKSMVWQYDCAAWQGEPVRLTGAVRLRRVDSG